MRRFSRRFLLVEGKKYYLVSVKPPMEPWDDIGFFQKSQEKDEFGYMIKGEKLVCPHRSKLSIFAWNPLPDIWLMVPTICQDCWGCHRTPEGRYNCILRSMSVKQIDSAGKCCR